MSIPASARASLYGLLVAEIARIAALNEPIQLTPEGEFVDRKQIDKAEAIRKGSVFCHNFTSAFERAAFVLWALEIAEPVKQVDAYWTILRGHPRGSLGPYYQLQHDIDAIAVVVENVASSVFPSLDYVLSAYIDLIEQVAYPFVELTMSLKTNRELNSLPEVHEIVASTLPDGYDGSRAGLPLLIEAAVPHLAVLLERAGYLTHKQNCLVWTEAAAQALRGNWYALQGGDVSIDDGRPRLRMPN